MRPHVAQTAPIASGWLGRRRQRTLVVQLSGLAEVPLNSHMLAHSFNNAWLTSAPTRPTANHTLGPAATKRVLPRPPRRTARLNALRRRLDASGANSERRRDAGPHKGAMASLAMGRLANDSISRKCVKARSQSWEVCPKSVPTIPSPTAALGEVCGPRKMLGKEGSANLTLQHAHYSRGAFQMLDQTTELAPTTPCGPPRSPRTPRNFVGLRLAIPAAGV